LGLFGTLGDIRPIRFRKEDGDFVLKSAVENRLMTGQGIQAHLDVLGVQIAALEGIMKRSLLMPLYERDLSHELGLLLDIGYL
jgi:hypothetical protein